MLLGSQGSPVAWKQRSKEVCWIIQAEHKHIVWAKHSWNPRKLENWNYLISLVSSIKRQGFHEVSRKTVTPLKTTKLYDSRKSLRIYTDKILVLWFETTKPLVPRMHGNYGISSHVSAGPNISLVFQHAKWIQEKNDEIVHVFQRGHPNPAHSLPGVNHWLPFRRDIVLFTNQQQS